MIKGIGVDIVETARFERSTYEFAHLVLTDKEFEEWYKRGRTPQFLATRFAAKEAAVKAIGSPIGFQSIQIDTDDKGKPMISFIGSGYKIRNALVSISDEKDYVVAMVILE